MKVKKYSKVQENVSALVQIFNAIPSLLFSASAELAALKHPRQTVGTFPCTSYSSYHVTLGRVQIIIFKLITRLEGYRISSIRN